MPLSDHARWRVVLRAVGTVVAVASAVVAIWLIARGNDSKTVQIGVIIGLWAALLGSATLLGTRRAPVAGGEGGLRPADLDRVVEASTQSARAAAQQAATAAAEAVAERAAREAADAAARNAVAAVQEANAGRELERRRTAEVERERDEATRREFALSLELMLRREMERVLRDELDALRQEVAGLRNDLTEKVPGQIRLERIETTRLIGSDLEALQAEVRRLGEERAALGGSPPPAVTLASSLADVRTVEHVAPAVVDPLEPAPPAAAPAPAPEPVVAPAPEPAVEASAPPTAAQPEPTMTPRGSEETRHESAPAVPDARASASVAPVPSAPAASATPALPAPAPETETETETEPRVEADPSPTLSFANGGDPFAGLPRLSRWVDPFADDAAPAPAAATSAPEATPTGGHAVSDAAPAAEDHPRYVGRRRQRDGDADGDGVVGAAPALVRDAEAGPEQDPQPEAAPVGRRHARSDAEAEERPAGRRRRRDDDSAGGGHARPELVPDDVLARLLGR